MQELRLVGIADDGEHLLLSGDGERYKLPLNDELRATVRRDRRVTKAGAAATQPDSPLRPRDVQGLIRGGVPLEEIAERAGWPLEKVQRYEGPIRAERDYVSERAQSVVLPSRVETVTLRERAAARLADRGVEAERVVWDSWKTDEVHWTVVVRFPAGGRLREATWLFDPVGHSLRTVDDEARWLGGDELPSAGDESPEAAAKSAATQRKRTAARDGRREKVYDVESEGGVADAQPPHLGAALSDESGGLTASMRARQASRSRAHRGRAGAGTSPTAIPGQTSAPEVTRVERIDVGTTPPPAPSHPRPEELRDSSGKADEVDQNASADSAQATPASSSETAQTARQAKRAGKNSKQERASEASTDASRPEADSDAEETSQDNAQESSSNRPQSKRRGSRRSRAATPRLSVREAIRGEDDESDDGLFGELPGFHDGGEAAVVHEDQAVTVSHEDAEHTDVEQEDFAADAPADSDDETGDVSKSSTTKSAQDVPDRASKSRSGRPSVPSWDDIMFGGRGSKN